MTEENFIESIKDAEYVKENIIAVVCNATKNKQLLREVPHILKEDLAIYFKVIMAPIFDEEFGTITICNEHLSFIGNPTVEELYEAAKKNLKKTSTIKSTENIMKNMMLKVGMPEEMVSLMSSMPPKQQMYVINNNNYLLGAANMFDTDLLDEVVEIVNSNLYILPSSIHEVIVVSENFGSPDFLVGMVRKVNSTRVAPEEQLSDNVYHYDTKTKEITLVRQ